ncbi:hypothetical protein PUMCH_002893 [Australozyma saopauloensis]|uniref:Autophagy-related protein 3 n=1 Tax=Australozyma saopauloensis TaxID=291208 RepID=A0AAX4HAJ0_9ASCO|nr:hypothetical protein PUMCH_002893 [[Candida] saopauloensis]
MNIRSKLSSLREYLTPINNESNFHSTGQISPDEFVKAGDYLVFKFPTWQWGTCPPALQKSFLPPDKQFLVTRHVPSYRRVSSYLPEIVDGDEVEEGDEEWGIPCFNDKKESGNTFEDVAADAKSRLRDSSKAAAAPELDDLDDLIEDDVEDVVDDVDAAIAAEIHSLTLDGSEVDDFTEIASDAALLVRKYDLYILYSTSYRVPKLYLVGFNANGIPLLPKQMYEDISGDYKDKTATIENLPMSYNTTAVSIHPCKHSSVMKVFMRHSKLGVNGTEDSKDGEATGGIRVDQYLVIFLKFIASVTPGIEYDFTMDAL